MASHGGFLPSKGFLKQIRNVNEQETVPAPRSEPRFATRRSGARGTRSLALKEQSTPARRSLLEQRKERFHVRFARKGGVARAKKLTAEQRRASASKPAKARWGKNHHDFAAPEQTPLKNAATPDLFDLQSISGIPSPDSLPSECFRRGRLARVVALRPQRACACRKRPAARESGPELEYRGGNN